MAFTTKSLEDCQAASGSELCWCEKSASQPQLVKLDEPLTALNESPRREVWRLMRKLRRDWRLSMLLITHDIAEA